MRLWNALSFRKGITRLLLPRCRLPIVAGRWPLILAAVVPAALRAYTSQAMNRLYVTLARFIKEVRRCKQIPVVRNRHGRHFLGTFIQSRSSRKRRPANCSPLGTCKVNEIRASHDSDSNSLAEEMRPAFSRFNSPKYPAPAYFFFSFLLS